MDDIFVDFPFFWGGGEGVFCRPYGDAMCAGQNWTNLLETLGNPSSFLSIIPNMGDIRDRCATHRRLFQGGISIVRIVVL